jgi:N-carbamoylputrescine amidase
MQDACRKNEIAAVPNIYLEENGRRYDASPMIDSDGSILGISKMVHVVQMQYYYEQDYYAPSDNGFHVYDTAVGRIGIVICFDRHLPESIRTCVLQGAQLIVVPTANVKGEPLDLFEWEMRVQAMHNGVFIAMCNRVGQEGDMDFAGESLVIDPFGGVLVKADDQEQLILADIDFSQVEQAHRMRPYLALRRPETYRLK